MTIQQALGLALGGVPLGAMYALQAMGIVLVHKTSGVFNFAQGAIGATAAFAAASLGRSHGLPTPLAVLGGLLVGAFLGVVIERFTIRPVVGRLQQSVVTLGWLLGLQGLIALMFVQTAGRPYISLFPATPALQFRPLFLALAWDQVGVTIVAVVVAIGLAIFFKVHPLGMKMRAVADDREGAGLLGIDVGRVSAFAWALGASMAALSGILVTPILAKLDATALIVFTVQALAAALVGRLESLPRTFVGGLALGMSQPVLTRLFNLGPGSNELIALLFVLGALLIRKQAGRGDSGAGGLPPMPLRPMPIGMAKWGILGVLLAVGVAHLFADPGSFSRSIAVTWIWSLGVLSIVMLGGVAGQVSLAQAALMGVGGYGAAIAVASGIPFLAALLIGGALAAFTAALIGLPALRLRGLELAIATLSLSFAADRYFFKSFKPLVGPFQRRPLPRPDAFDRTLEIVTPDGSMAIITDWRPYALLCFVIFLLVAFGVAGVRRGRAGAAFTALRSSEAATSAMGFNVISVKLRGFAAAGFVAGIGGALFAGLSELANSTPFGFDRSISLLAFAVIAGIGSVPGAVLGGFIVTWSALSAGGGDGGVASSGGDWTPVITAAALIAVLALSPDGVSGLVTKARDRMARSAKSLSFSTDGGN
ncbi:MAG: branched-subunit amino acid ABC-type transport system permease component [Glaciecola sp.]|jgi:branched-subunit amino acid ABC-type transport system permease component